MAPPILFMEDIRLNFGGTPLLEGAAISVHAADRICLVGRNGSGKSTLMKMAAGQIEPDSGEIFVQPGTTVRYLSQQPDFGDSATLEDYALAGLTSGDDPHRVTYLFSQLGLTGKEDPRLVSGGEARRAALVKALAPVPDILLLDEPTNHLDLPAIEWMEAELKSMRSAIVLISHDRRFLENLSRKTVWIDRGRTHILNKGFAAFEDWRDEILEQEEIERHKLNRKIAREDHWITHGVSGRRKRNMRRVRELAALRENRAADRGARRDVKLAEVEAAQSGKLVAELKNVSKQFEDRKIVSKLSTIVQRGDRLGIVGPNGAGKTTLVNLITGQLQPDSGTVRLGVNLEVLVIDQKRADLDLNATLRETLTGGGGDMVSVGGTNRHVMSYMKDFLFLSEQANTPVSALSGGERGRLLLARGLAQPSNLLVLDEPTNDLDLETLDLLQEFIADYDGTVIVVSHDRDFLDRICTSVIVSAGNGAWQEYAGGYSDMTAQRGNDVEAARKEKSSTGDKPGPVQRQKTRSGPSGLSFKQKHALETLPGEIGKLEDEISKLQKALSDPQLYASDRKKFNAYTAALTEREEMLADKQDRWLELEILNEETGR